MRELILGLENLQEGLHALEDTTKAKFGAAMKIPTTVSGSARLINNAVLTGGGSASIGVIDFSQYDLNINSLLRWSYYHLRSRR